MTSFDLTLYLVTDRLNGTEEEFLHKLDEACRGGVTLVQLREKEITSGEYYELALKVKRITDHYQIPLIIDDRVDIALAADASGVHVGQSDLPVRQARRLMGPDKIIGATAKTPEQAQRAMEEGADYLGIGAIYPTTTKVKTVLTSTDTLKEILENVPLPAVAIGGLNSSNLSVLENCPISGIAVVSALMKSEYPFDAAVKLKKQVEGLAGWQNRKEQGW